MPICSYICTCVFDKNLLHSSDFSIYVYASYIYHIPGVLASGSTASIDGVMDPTYYKNADC